MTFRIILALSASALLIMSAAARAAESISPRTYTAEDCQVLNSQIDDSIRFSNIGSAMASTIQGQRANADRACNSGQYAAGTRQLRDILDEIIATRSPS
jgi:hypothetical protein